MCAQLRGIRLGTDPMACPFIFDFCVNSGGITDAELMTGARRSSLDELAAQTLASSKVMVF